MGWVSAISSSIIAASMKYIIGNLREEPFHAIWTSFKKDDMTPMRLMGVPQATEEVQNAKGT